MTLMTTSFFDQARASATPIEITAEHFEHMLTTLPPKFARGCFAMGEPVAHTDEGTTYHWAAQRGSKFLAFYGTKKQAEAAFST